MQAFGERFPYKGVLGGKGQRWEERKGNTGRMCGLQKEDGRPRQDLKGNYSLLFPPLRWDIMGNSYPTVKPV